MGVFTLSNMNISETSGLIAIKFYLKHHIGVREKLQPDWIRTLVSMATDSSNLVLMGKTASPIFIGCFDRFFFILACKDHIRENLD